MLTVWSCGLCSVNAQQNTNMIMRVFVGLSFREVKLA